MQFLPKRFSSIILFVFTTASFIIPFNAVVINKHEEPMWLVTSDVTNPRVNYHQETSKLSDATTRSSIIRPKNIEGGSETKSKLSLVSSETTRKSVLLNDGEASNSVSFELQVSKDESILTVLHVVNDSSILTRHWKHVTKLKRAQIVDISVFDITLRHEFKGTVGNVSYLLHIATSSRQYTVSGIYYVAGLAAFLPSQNTPSSGLSAVHINRTQLDEWNWKIPFLLEYNRPGPDANGFALSLLEVLGNAQISIKQDGSDGHALMNYNSSMCRPLQTVARNKSGIYKFTNDSCGIGFTSQGETLVLNLNHRREGILIVWISLPSLTVDGEAFKTSLNVKVGQSVIPKPVVLLGKDPDILLDFYGSELITLRMFNTIQPAQIHNATSYFLDLPDGRYAEVDFDKSSLVNPVQSVVFVSLPFGEENDGTKRKLSNSRNAHTFSSMRTETIAASANNHSSLYAGYRLLGGPDTAPDFVGWKDKMHLSAHNLSTISPMNSEPLYGMPTLKGEVKASMSDAYTVASKMLGFSKEMIRVHGRPHEKSKIINVGRMEESSTYESIVHVLIPPSTRFVAALSQSNQQLKTKFASKVLALVQPIDQNYTGQQIRVELELSEYSSSNFSEHKARQIQEALLKQIATIDNGARSRRASIVGLQDTIGSLLVRYDIDVFADPAGVASELTNGSIARGIIAKETYLGNARIPKLSAVARRPHSSSDILSDENENRRPRSLEVDGSLIAAIVILCMIVSIPLFALCFGFIIIRRHRQDGESFFAGTGDSVEAVDAPVANTDTSENKVRTGTSAVVKDNFGRANEQSYESFKMQKELFKAGYFGDNNPQEEHPR